MARGLFTALLVIAALTASVGDASAHLIGCPAGQAIRGIDLVTQRLVCVSVSSDQVAALQSDVAALQGQVAALQGENAAQAAVIANLQGEVDQLQTQTVFTSPNGAYSITVANTGIRLVGPGLSLELRNDVGPLPIIELTAGADVLLSTGRHTVIGSGSDTVIASGRDLLVTSGRSVDVASSADMSLSADQTMTLQGATAIQLNGSCGPVARGGDTVALDGTLLKIVPNGSNVRSC
jgi:hypothetical protein